MKTKPNPLNKMNAAERFIIGWIQSSVYFNLDELEGACRAHLNLAPERKLPPEYQHALDWVAKEWRRMTRRKHNAAYLREVRAPEIKAAHEARKTA